MGKYRAADLVNAPTLLSLARLPLAVLFPFTLERPALSIAVLAAAAASDVLDGFIARRFDLTTATGAVVDGVTDKLFAAVVLVSLLLRGRLALSDVALLGAREIVEAPFIAWLVLSAAARRSKIDERANVIGKAATTLQFATVFLVLIQSDLGAWAVWATAVVGAAAGVSYWARAFAGPPKPSVS